MSEVKCQMSNVLRMKNRIDKLFKEKTTNILSIFFTAGYPELNSTVSIIKAIENAGADLIEIGMPYSDPLADGPTIQKSSSIALENGMNLILLFKQIEEARNISKLPFIIMGYYNQLLQFGFVSFCQKCNSIGIDGLIIPDLPPEVYKEKYINILNKYNLKISFLITPRSEKNRIILADKLSDSFVYVVSTSSVTGKKIDIRQNTLEYFDKIRKMKLKNPLLIGFGINNNESFNTACTYANGGIIGSAFINTISDSKNFNHSVKQFINSIKH